ncbi:hypothetical protein ACQCVB_11010 [Fictibacillus phosphorivorans]|uniref:hypothetical protein n=1 Tax=Fictibacillus phosphorivorans TaxID=1221500 RepID=UPI003CE7E6E6
MKGYFDNGIIKRRRSIDQYKLTAEDVLEAIDELSNEEKEKLLQELYYKFYNKSGHEKLEVDWE